MCTCVVNHVFVCICVYMGLMFVWEGICVFISVWHVYIMYVSVYVGVRACVCVYNICICGDVYL